MIRTYSIQELEFAGCIGSVRDFILAQNLLYTLTANGFSLSVFWGETSPDPVKFLWVGYCSEVKPNLYIDENLRFFSEFKRLYGSDMLAFVALVCGHHFYRVVGEPPESVTSAANRLYERTTATPPMSKGDEPRELVTDGAAQMPLYENTQQRKSRQITDELNAILARVETMEREYDEWKFDISEACRFVTCGRNTYQFGFSPEYKQATCSCHGFKYAPRYPCKHLLGRDKFVAERKARMEPME